MFFSYSYSPNEILKHIQNIASLLSFNLVYFWFTLCLRPNNLIIRDISAHKSNDDRITIITNILGSIMRVVTTESPVFVGNAIYPMHTVAKTMKKSIIALTIIKISSFLFDLYPAIAAMVLSVLCNLSDVKFSS